MKKRNRRWWDILINSVSELPQELLVVLLGDPEDSVDESLPVVDVQLPHVHFSVEQPRVVTVDSPIVAIVFREGLDDAGPQPIVGRKLLDRRPPERLFLVVGAAVAPPRTRTASGGEHVFHVPTRSAHTSAYASAHSLHCGREKTENYVLFFSWGELLVKEEVLEAYLYTWENIIVLHKML